MDQFENRTDLLLAAQVLDLSAKLRHEDFVRSGIIDIEDPNESKRAEHIWYAQHRLAYYTSSAIDMLLDVDRQIRQLIRGAV